MPANKDAAQDMVFPLRSAIGRYLVTYSAFNDMLDSLECHLETLGEEAVSEARENWGQASTELGRLYARLTEGEVSDAYRKLEDAWENDGTRPNDKTLEEAWRIIQGARSRKDALREEARALRPPSNGASAAGVATAVKALSDHLGKLREDVFSKASEQLAKVQGPPDVNGKAETKALLDKVAALTPTLENVGRLTEKAEQPMRFPKPHDGRLVMTAMSNLDEGLEALDRRIVALSRQHLSDDAVRSVMLGAVREKLKGAETQFSDSEDLAKSWPKIRRDYGSSSRIVRLGHRINRYKRLVDGRLKKWRERPEGYEQPIRHLEEADGRLRNAYRHLLEGDALDAEVELERAEDLVQDAYTWRIIARVKHFWRWLQRSAGSTASTEQTANPSPWWRRLLGSVVIALLLVGLALALDQIPRIMKLVTFIWGHAPTMDVWKWVGVLLCLLSLYLLWLWLRPYWLSVIYGYVSERWENLATSLLRLFARVSSGLLSLVIIVTLILAYQQAVPREQIATWGSLYDLVVAFGLGVLAHRALRALQSQGDGLVGALRGDEKQANASTKTSS